MSMLALKTDWWKTGPGIAFLILVAIVSFVVTKKVIDNEENA